MRILITGGCGFIGANLVHTLERLGKWEVRVLDNESLGKRHHLRDFRGEFVKGDIRDPDIVEKSVRDVDAVVHLAADTKVVESVQNPTLNFDVNVVGTLNILEAMRRHCKTKLVSASTGGAIVGPTAGPVHEKMAPAPLSPYGASKLAVEGYCSAYSGSYGLQIASLRFSNVFGPLSNHKSSVVAAFFKSMLAGKPLIIYGDGTQVRDYVFVGDICEGIIASLKRPVTGPILLGSGRPRQLNELIDEMQQVTGIIPQIGYEASRPGEIHSTYCDLSLARSVLGFDPVTEIRRPLAATWQWFQQQQA